MNIYKAILFFIVIAVSNNILRSQNNSNSAGKDFLLCFPQNEDTLNQANNIFLQIYISSYNGDVCHFTLNYNLDDAPVIVNDSVSGKNIATINIPIALEIHSNKTNEKKGIFISSDQEINVSAMSRQRATTDAFLCYPINILDTSYIVASYKNKMYSLVGHPNARYSNIVVAASEDSSIVDIFPTVPLEGFGNNNGLQPVRITLNRGETRQIIARITKPYDVTGTIVKSNKKIVVFSTHQGAFIPPKGYYDGNTDAIMKQTLPISRLGTNAVFTPIPNSRYNNLTLGRVISPFDNNILTLSDTSIILNKQQYYEFEFNSAFIAKTSKPSLFAEYCLSGNYWDYADPFLLLLPSIENYQNKYLFISPFVFNHFISIIIDSLGRKSLELDGVSLADSIGSKIPGTNLFSFNVSLQTGAHEIKSDSVFGLVAFGFGEAESYGYIPGMRTDSKIDYYLDKTPPRKILSVGCNSSVVFSDEGEYKTGIEKINILNNVNIIFTKDASYQEYYSEKYNLELIDPFQEGKLLYEIFDLVGNSKVDSILLKGFSLSYNRQATGALKFQEYRCDTISLNNTGHFIQNIRAAFLKNTVFSVPPSLTEFTIDSSGCNKLTFCVYPNRLGLINDTLLLIDDCDRIIRLPIEARVEPNTYAEESLCGVKIRLITSNIYLNDANNQIITGKFTGAIHIYSIAGKLIYSKQYYNEYVEDMRNFNTGVYFMVITDQSGNQRRENLLITN